MADDSDHTTDNTKRCLDVSSGGRRCMRKRGHDGVHHLEEEPSYRQEPELPWGRLRVEMNEDGSMVKNLVVEINGERVGRLPMFSAQVMFPANDISTLRVDLPCEFDRDHPTRTMNIGS